MSFEEYAVKARNDCLKIAITKGLSSEAVEVLQLITQQNLHLLKSYHDDVVVPLLVGIDGKKKTASGT